VVLQPVQHGQVFSIEKLQEREALAQIDRLL
jgi:hypothetical protein